MANTHDAPDVDLHVGPLRLYLHSLFFHVQRVPERHRRRMPLVQRGTTYGTSLPYRLGPSVMLRVGWRWALVVGYWDLPDPDAVDPLFINSEMLAFRATEIETWGKPSTPTSLVGTAYEDTPGVEVVNVEGADEVTHVQWQGERA